MLCFPLYQCTALNNTFTPVPYTISHKIGPIQETEPKVAGRICFSFVRLILSSTVFEVMPQGKGAENDQPPYSLEPACSMQMKWDRDWKVI